MTKLSFVLRLILVYGRMGVDHGVITENRDNLFEAEILTVPAPILRCLIRISNMKKMERRELLF